jgi:phosphoribosylamine-glycine ligase
MNIAILGKKQAELDSYLDSKNYKRTYFEDRNASEDKINTIQLDYSDEKKAIEEIVSYHNKCNFDVVFTIYEKYIVTVAKIAQLTNLRGLSLDSAIACTDKTVMRTRFMQSSEKISPEYKKVNSLDDLLEFASTHTFPLMLKPANLAKSLLVTKNNTVEELIKNYEIMISKIDSVYKKHSPHNERAILVEEFMDGSIHSVDAYVDSSGKAYVLPRVVDYKTGYDIGYNDNFHYSRLLPSSLPISTQKQIIKVAEIGIKSLGMSNTAAHVEIIVTDSGPKIVEIGARNGGYRERMYELANGIDIYGNLIALLNGEQVDLTIQKDENCAVLELFPKNKGFFNSIKNLDNLKNLSSLLSLKIKVQKGEEIGLSSDGYRAACIVLLHNQDQNTFFNDLQYIEQNVIILTD